ncbi:MAG TPA: glucose 1-dehydrogenase [Terriglobales bacterium]|jgi:meso-butanediol dehydrogenase/(S,S)-butanediol dehydrogenase/diacetyl reductase|nr:glucose 1-dehydrogenase [Terriglobales bacterium]
MGKYQELQGKVAIVTGAGRGIGKAIALRLASEGVSVSANDVDLASVSELAKEIESTGQRALATKVDVTNQKDIDAMISATVEKFGELNIFVNNAGIGAIAKLLDTDEQTWDRVMAVNAKGTFLGCKAAAKQMIKQGKGGRIIVNASGAGKIAPGKATPLGAYAASKHAVVGLTKQLGLELSGYQILVNCLCPGIVDTPLWDQIDREIAKIEGVPVGSVKDRAIASVPLGRIQTPEDVANVVAFLASDDASYITADAINCAGGLLPY